MHIGIVGADDVGGALGGSRVLPTAIRAALGGVAILAAWLLWVEVRYLVRVAAPR